MKTNHKVFIAIASSAFALAVSAQTIKDEYTEFRDQMMDEYQTFRKSVLSDYDSFLEAMWADFEVFGAKSKYSQPKPHQAPEADAPVKGENIEIPSPDAQDAPIAKTTPKTPGLPKTPVLPKVPSTPKTQPVPKTPVPSVAVTKNPQPKTPDRTKPESQAPGSTVAETTPATPPPPMVSKTGPTKHDTPSISTSTASAPTAAPTTKVPAASVIPSAEYTFPYRGMELAVADVPLKVKSLPMHRSDYADQWRSFQSGGGLELVESFRELAERHNLNDYLTYDVLMAYTAARYPDVHPSGRMALVQYVMANLGCDVRIAMDESNQPMILIPFDQTVYGRRFLTVNGYPYYIFGAEGGDGEPHINGLISTCVIPTDRDPGRHIDLLVQDLRLPENEKNFDIEFGKLHLTGSYNQNIMPVLYRYPQMPTQDFASSNVLPELRDDIVRQVKEQLAGMPQREAVDALLRFTQSGFKYATDGDYHGFEKPYFFEEMFYYPKCDCEDRSIFYTYLLWNALGVENHLIAYPVHESASVCLDDTSVGGDHYVHNGKTFYISDPTYIGARTGQCMPNFRKVAPTIDKEYK